MRFILVPGCMENFDLRTKYEAIRHVNLEATPSKFGMPTLFGGTDIKSRRAQIAFLEKMKMALEKFLSDEKNIVPWQANLMAVKIMIAACLSVQEKIGRSKESSALYRLINEYLGVTPANFMDEEDKKNFIITAWKLVQPADSLDKINWYLRDSSLSFAEEEWREFSEFLDSKRQKYLIKKTDQYPITALSQPLFQEAFAYGGATMGWVVAEVLSSSAVAVIPRIQLTTFVGGALLFVGSAGNATIGLLAPTIATRLINSFCSVSLATMSGKAMGYVGYGAGTIIGYPFDLTFNLLKSAGSLLLSCVSKTPDMAAIDGIRIIDGTPIINGQPIRLQLVSKENARLQISSGVAVHVIEELAPEVEEEAPKLKKCG